MPNNPGRIEGDYVVGEKEEVKYVDPGDFGAIKGGGNISDKRYTIFVWIAVIVMALVLIFALVR